MTAAGVALVLAGLLALVLIAGQLGGHVTLAAGLLCLAAMAHGGDR